MSASEAAVAATSFGLMPRGFSLDANLMMFFPAAPFRARVRKWVCPADKARWRGYWPGPVRRDRKTWRVRNWRRRIRAQHFQHRRLGRHLGQHSRNFGVLDGGLRNRQRTGIPSCPAGRAAIPTWSCDTPAAANGLSSSTNAPGRFRIDSTSEVLSLPEGDVSRQDRPKNGWYCWVRPRCGAQ